MYRCARCGRILETDTKNPSNLECQCGSRVFYKDRNAASTKVIITH